MQKKSMMFSSGTRPDRGSSITIFPDPKNWGIMEVVNVKWWDAHGNWIMVARDLKGRNHTIKNKDFKYWTKENMIEDDAKKTELQKPGRSPIGLVNIDDFESGLSQTSSWLSKSCKFAIPGRRTPSRPARTPRR